MPRKYKPTADEYFFVSGSYSVYGMLRPIEEQLKKGGYRGLTLTDFNHNLCNMLEIEENPDMNFRDKMQNASVVDEGEIIVDGRVIAGKTLTKNGRRDFRDYINKYSNLLELLIKNTPPEEYPEEVAEMKYHQTYIRMLKVFGSRQLFSDKLAFLHDIRYHWHSNRSFYRRKKSAFGFCMDKSDALYAVLFVEGFAPYSCIAASVFRRSLSCRIICFRTSLRTCSAHVQRDRYRSVGSLDVCHLRQSCCAACCFYLFAKSFCCRFYCSCSCKGIRP